MSQEKLKVRWAFDPRDTNRSGWQSVKKVLQNFSKNCAVEIVPTHLLRTNKNWLLTPPAIQVEDPKEELTIEMKAALKDLGLENTSEPEIIVAEGYSLRSDIQKFVDVLNEDSCDILVLNSHAKGALKRFFLGSFAENVLLRTRVPVIVIPPDVDPDVNPKKVLFTTDFSQTGRLAFEDFLSHEKDMIDEVVLYSKSIYPVSSLATDPFFAIDQSLTVTEIWEEIHKKKVARGKEWSELSSKYGVEIKAIVDEDTEDLMDCINGHARDEKVGMIVMPSFIDQKMALLTGSFTRDLVRSAEVPVYVRHYFSN